MVGTAVWSPYHLLTPSVTLPFWLQRAISCVEKQADGEGVGARVSLVVLAFSPPRAPSCFSFSLSFCPFPLPLVFYSLCPSYLLTFYYFIFVLSQLHQTLAPSWWAATTQLLDISLRHLISSSYFSPALSWLSSSPCCMSRPTNCCQMRCGWPDGTPRFPALVFFEYLFSKYNYLWNSRRWKAFHRRPKCVWLHLYGSSSLIPGIVWRQQGGRTASRVSFFTSFIFLIRFFSAAAASPCNNGYRWG